MNLSFDAEKHEYTLDGNVIPSATQIVRRVLGQDLSSVSTEVLKSATERGNVIHKEVETKKPKSLEAKWILEQLNDEYKHEQMFYTKFTHINYNEIYFAGTADLVGETTLADIKTQSAKDIPYWTLQLNLYNLFFEKDELKVFWTPNSGNFEIVDIKKLNYDQLAEAFYALQENKPVDLKKLGLETNDKTPTTVINLDLVVYEQSEGKLKTNVEKLKALVEKKLVEYKTENYSPDNIRLAKNDRAILNKAAKMLNDRKNEIRREFLRPLDDFENGVAETVRLIKHASEQIDAIVKEVEEREREEKKSLAKSIFEKHNFTLVSFEQIFERKWTNKTCNIKTIETEIAEKVSKIKLELETLDKLGNEEVKAFYLNTLDLTEAIAIAERQKQAQERLEAEQERVNAEISSEPVQAEPTQEVEFQPVFETGEEKPALYECEIFVKGTEKQLNNLEQFLIENKIEFNFKE